MHRNAPIYLAGHARPGPSFSDSLRMHAVARVLLDGVIHNVQVSWVKLGVAASQEVLRSGANDFGGTLMEETISRMAGAGWGIRMTPVGVRRRDPFDRSHAGRADHDVRSDRDERRFLTPIRQVR